MPSERTELERIPDPDELLPVQAGSTYPPAYYPEGYVDEYAEARGKQGGVEKLAEVWRVIRKRKALILVITAVVTLFVAAEVSRLRDTYSATVILEVRKDSGGPLAAAADSDVENTVGINTKSLMFKSRPLLEDVVTRLGLDRDERFVDVSTRRSWGEILLPMVGLSGHATNPKPRPQGEGIAAGSGDPASEGESNEVGRSAHSNGIADFPESNPRLDPYVSIVDRGLEVSHPRDTQALKITFTHTDPMVAAAVANGVAQSFIRRNFETNVDQFANTSSWLQRSTADLKAKVAQAEQALADYSRDHNMLPAQGQTLTSDKLVRLHEQVTRADVDLMLKKSLYEQVQQGRLDTLPEAFSDPKINDLQRRLGELKVTAAQLGVSYGPDNPKLREVQQEVGALQQQIDSSKRALEEKLRADYQRADRDDKSLRTALEQAKAEAAQLDQSSIQYNILRQDATIARSVYEDFLRKTKQADLEVAQQRSNVSVIQPAQVPKSPDGPAYGLAVLIAFFVSMSAGVGIALLLEHMDKSIKDVADVNRYLQLPTLGVIPAVGDNRQRVLPLGPRRFRRHLLIGTNGSTPHNGADASDSSPIALLTSRAAQADADVSVDKLATLDSLSLLAEAYRALRTSVLLSTPERPPRTLLFTSSTPAEGKTTTVVNTAISFSQLGDRVLIIDGDMRKPSAQNGGGARREVGLSSYLSGAAEIDDAIKRLDIPGVSILPCGPIPPNPAELISSERMKELVATLAERYDHILIDSPPLLYATDSVILSTLVDGVILVVRGGESSRDAVFQSRLLLSSVGARIFGIVLNGIDFQRTSSRYSNYYPYAGNGSQKKESEGASDILLHK